MLSEIDLHKTDAFFFNRLNASLSSSHKNGCWVSFLEWVIVGGESGKNARPMNPQWVRKIRDQCVDAGVPFFFKQWGEYLHIDLIPMNFACDSKDNTVMIGNDCFYKIGTKRAGNILDGQVWQQIPEVKL